MPKFFLCKKAAPQTKQPENTEEKKVVAQTKVENKEVIKTTEKIETAVEKPAQKMVSETASTQPVKTEPTKSEEPVKTQVPVKTQASVKTEMSGSSEKLIKTEIPKPAQKNDNRDNKNENQRRDNRDNRDNKNENQRRDNQRRDNRNDSQRFENRDHALRGHYCRDFRQSSVLVLYSGADHRDVAHLLDCRGFHDYRGFQSADHRDVAHLLDCRGYRGRMRNCFTILPII